MPPVLGNNDPSKKELSHHLEISMGTSLTTNRLITSGSSEELTSIPRLNDRSDFERLDHRFEEGQYESIAALREIRQRQLFKEQYGSFDDYMAARGRTRQWATQQINWLRRQELLEELTGKASYQLTVDEAQKLGPLVPNDDLDDDEVELYAQMYVDAVIEAQSEADAQSKPRTAKMTERAVQKRVGYIENRRAFGDDLQLEESVEIDRLSGRSHDEIGALLASAREVAKQEERPAIYCFRELVEQALGVDSLSKASDEPADKSERRQHLAVVEPDQPVAPGYESDGIVSDKLQYDVAFDGAFANVVGFTTARYHATELADLFNTLADEIAQGQIVTGTITIR
jgi:hypothetical protein